MTDASQPQQPLAASTDTGQPKPMQSAKEQKGAALAAKLTSLGNALAFSVPLLVFAIAFFAFPHFFPHQRAWMFVTLLCVLIAFVAGIGWAVDQRLDGALIDGRNLVSLSRLQAIAWTIIVLAAFAAAAAYNVARAGSDFSIVSSLSIQLPGDLLLAMGISATSLVGAPAILSLKTDQPTPPNAEQAAADRTGVSTTAIGQLFTKQNHADASLADLVTGDEVGNAGAVDISKVQQLLITIVLLGVYAVYVFGAFGATTSVITTLPALDKSFVWLLGLSHASYLAYKAAPHTPTAPASAA